MWEWLCRATREKQMRHRIEVAKSSLDPNRPKVSLQIRYRPFG